jgi:16S rRNA (cytidine1402-2'-O)-methyltransferase
MQNFKLENALYVVATPIGNLQDITLRALEALKKVDFIFCEDTRVSARLLQAYEIEGKKLIAYNDHSDDKKTHKKITDLLDKGSSLALISDAGTPLISDPGHKLISFLRERNYKIIPIPGASSLTAMLSVSGLAVDNFLFLGFLPSGKVQKEKLLKSLPKNFTFVFFESPNRLLETLETLLEFNNRKICVARELTKIYEEIISGSSREVLDFFIHHSEKVRGELVVAVEKSDKNEEITPDFLIEEITKAMKEGYSIKELSQNLAEIYGIHKKEIYQMALANKQKS